MPRSAISNSPFFEAIALVNAPFTWPKRVDSSKSVGMEPVLTGNERPIVARRIQMQRLGDNFFTGPALALQKHG